MTSSISSGKTRVTADGWSRGALALGILAVVSYFAGFAAVAWIWPGAPLPIAIATTAHYLLPLAGVIVGHIARRREGRSSLSTAGLVLSYLSLAAALVPLLIGVLSLLASS